MTFISNASNIYSKAETKRQENKPNTIEKIGNITILLSDKTEFKAKGITVDPWYSRGSDIKI